MKIGLLWKKVLVIYLRLILLIVNIVKYEASKILIIGIVGTLTKGEWLGKNLPLGAKIGFDPMIMSFNQWKSLQHELDKYGLALLPVSINLVDIIWDNQPPPPSGLLIPLEISYTGIYIYIYFKMRTFH